MHKIFFIWLMGLFLIEKRKLYAYICFQKFDYIFYKFFGRGKNKQIILSSSKKLHKIHFVVFISCSYGIFL